MATLQRRAAKQADKRKRIHAAAKALFRARGYQGTTTRAIAERAGIAAGTLFLYVRDKDEALALVYGDDVAAALESGAVTRPPRLRFVSGLLHRVRGLYQLYARHPALALRYVRRIPVLEAHQQGAHDALNLRFSGALQDEVERAVRSGELRPGLDVPLATRTLFAVVRVSLFGWLATGAGSVEEGLGDLEQTLRLLVEGLGR
jgi:AcrR family transcriptional regulator